MRPDHEVDGVLVKDTALDHGASPTPTLFSGLEKKCVLAGQIGLTFAQNFGDPEQRRGVHVVATCVHHAFIHRSVGQSTLFEDGKSVDVRANHHALARETTLENRDRAGVGRASCEFPSQSVESVANDLRGAVLFEGEFGMGVQVMANSHHGIIGLVKEPCEFIMETSRHE